VISYSLRDPMLYGDFRNAFSEDEPRYYEDLLDYEAVYSLFLEVRSCCKNRVNHTEKILYQELLCMSVTVDHERIIKIFTMFFHCDYSI